MKEIGLCTSKVLNSYNLLSSKPQIIRLCSAQIDIIFLCSLISKILSIYCLWMEKRA